MPTLRSRDGTRIAFDTVGKGPALIIVVGAFSERSTGAPLAQALKGLFTVYNYDRRGRGESSDNSTYAVEREIEDLEALVAQAGGPAYVFGYSSGAILAIRAALSGLKMPRLALYEPPPTGGRAHEIGPQLNKLVLAGRRGDAVELFQTEAVGMPAEVVARMRTAPFRAGLEQMAKTLPYESAVLAALEPEQLASLNTPTLVMDGDQSPPVMREAAYSLAEALPRGRYRSLQGQGHDIVPLVVAPLLEEFFLTQ